MKSKIIALIMIAALAATVLSGCGEKKGITITSTTLEAATAAADTEAPADAPTQAPTEAPTDPPTEPPTEVPTEAPAPDYSSYVGTWAYVFDSNGELDADHALVTSVTFNSINGTIADMTIFRGNIVALTQIDVTGEIVDGKIDFSYDQDGWFNRGHGTVTLNGDSVHLSATVDEMGDGARIGLNCEEDLTRA